MLRGKVVKGAGGAIAPSRYRYNSVRNRLVRRNSPELQKSLSVFLGDVNTLSTDIYGRARGRAGLAAESHLSDSAPPVSLPHMTRAQNITAHNYLDVVHPVSCYRSRYGWRTLAAAFRLLDTKSALPVSRPHRRRRLERADLRPRPPFRLPQATRRSARALRHQQRCSDS